MKKIFMKKYLIVLPAVLIGILLISGCTSTGPQGWSGCVNSDTNIYYGSLNSRIICINPDTRNKNLPFPNRESGEWYSNIRVSSSGGGLCGPMLCAPESTGTVLYSTPAVGDELAYIATYSGKLYSYNAETGSERWIYPRESTASLGSVVGNIILANDNIYVASSNGNIYAFSQDYGDKLWEYATGDRIWTTPAVTSDTVYAGSYDGNLYAISAEYGNEIWKIKLPASMASSPVVYEDKLVFGSFDRKLYSVNSADGSIKWQFDGGNWFWADPVIKDNHVFAPCLDNYLYALDGDTGSLMWKIEIGKVASRPVISGDTLAAVSEDGELSMIDINNGSLKQKVTIGYKTVAPLLVFNNVIYVHAMDDYIYAVDINSGALLWRFLAEIS